MFYDLDTELSYQCDPGYKRKGFQVAQCFFYNGTARWFGPDLTCHPIDCGPPEEILNGKRTGDCTTYRCQVCLLFLNCCKLYCLLCFPFLKKFNSHNCHWNCSYRWYNSTPLLPPEIEKKVISFLEPCKSSILY